MKKIKDLMEIEAQLNSTKDLTEIAYTYCVANYDKALEVSALVSILEIILNSQKEMIRELDLISII